MAERLVPVEVGVGLWAGVVTAVMGGLVKVAQLFFRHRERVKYQRSQIRTLRRALRQAQLDHLRDLEKVKQRTLPPPP